MTIATLPVTQDPAQVFAVQLDDTKIRFELRWNDRNQRFEMDMYYDDTNTAALAGLLLVLGVDLLEPFNLGLGSILLIDTTGTGMEASLTNFGDTVRLVWVSPDEVIPVTDDGIPDPYVPDED